MIITAQVANNIVDQNPNMNREFPKKQMRQLRRIESAIMRAAKRGKRFVNYYGDLYNCVFEVLEKNEYTVVNCCNYEVTRFVISWKKTK